MTLELFVNMITVVGVVGGLAFSGFQARASARDARQGAKVVAQDSLRRGVIHLQSILAIIVEHPDIAPFFYDATPLPTRGPDRVRALVVAEMLADCVESNLEAGRNLEEFGPNYQDWKAYAKYLAECSTAFRAVLSATWYKRVQEALSESTPHPIPVSNARSD